MFVTSVLSLFLAIGFGGEVADRPAACQDSVSFRMPKDGNTADRVTRAADWLKRHLTEISHQDEQDRITVVAWKDPTLGPADPNHLAGYLITDTLWSAKALQLFDPMASRRLEASLERLGWSGNGLHEVLFHRIDQILHCPADKDFMHGYSLGLFPDDAGRTVDLRVFRQKWDADFDVGHPRLFAEHAVYRAMHDFWQGRETQARRRLREVINDTRASTPQDRIFWDAENRILVDHVTYADWLAFRSGKKPVCRHYTFKLGVLLYGIRLLGIEAEDPSTLAGMKRRLWSAQTGSGGVAHFVDVRSDGTATIGRQPTGEASAIAVLAETVEAKAR